VSADLNVVALVGRLGRDVEAPQGQGPAKFSLAVNSSKKQGENWTEETNWIDIVYWHKSILPYLTKGKQIGVRGELRQERWSDRETGKERSRLVVVAQDIELLGGTREEGQGRVEGGSDGPRRENKGAGAAPAQGAATASRYQGPADNFSDDILF